MGPRLLSRGVEPPRRRKHGYCPASMGPRLLSRGVLQQIVRYDSVNLASMGPRLLSRGVPSKTSAVPKPLSGFNGAAASQPRSYKHASAEQIAYLASMGPRLLSRGVAGRAGGGRDAGKASMGPRLLSRGVVFGPPLPASRFPGFNGAAASQPRSFRELCRRLLTPLRFNGAAASQPRSWEFHGWHGGILSCFNGAAASQPRSSEDAIGRERRLPGFNGAAASQPRSSSKLLAWVTLFCDASMGPRLLSRGVARSCKRPATWHGRLQWGRGFSAAEFGRGEPPPSKLVRLQWGRGFSAAELTILDCRFWILDCFNGAAASQPRSCRQELTQMLAMSGLQWGRGFSAAELFDSSAGSVIDGPLQWGRGFSAAELKKSGSMPKVPGMLQWGRGFSAAEFVSN